MLALVALLSVAGLVVSGTAAAGKPGGGGGGEGPVPAGRIYFQDGFAATPWPGLTYPYAAPIESMDAAGGGRVSHPSMRWPGPARVSRQPHGGFRWFLDVQPVVGEPFLGAGTRSDVYAVREDGGARVRLTSDPLTQYAWCDWAPDEDASAATIGVTAKRFAGPTAADGVIPGSCGLYTARLTFDAAGDVVGLDAEPQLTLPLPSRVAGGLEHLDVGAFSWAPDMSSVAFNRNFVSPDRIFLANVATGVVTDVGPGRSPEWSPDGARIACIRATTSRSGKTTHLLESLRPDGSDRRTLTSVDERVSNTLHASLALPRWSPDGAHVAYNYVVSTNGGGTTTSFVYRVGSGGGTPTQLIQLGGISGSGGAPLLAWR
jgi:hypothetical protein